ARVVFSPDSAPAKPQKPPINRDFRGNQGCLPTPRLRSSSFGAAGRPLGGDKEGWAGLRSGTAWLACRAVAGGAGEGWRPGLDLNQDKEHCTAPALSLPPPGRGDHCLSRRGEPPLTAL